MGRCHIRVPDGVELIGVLDWAAASTRNETVRRLRSLPHFAQTLSTR